MNIPDEAEKRFPKPSSIMRGAFIEGAEWAQKEIIDAVNASITTSYYIQELGWVVKSEPIESVLRDILKGDN